MHVPMVAPTQMAPGGGGESLLLRNDTHIKQGSTATMCTSLIPAAVLILRVGTVTIALDRDRFITARGKGEKHRHSSDYHPA
jgi:hypothetical protein